SFSYTGWKAQWPQENPIRMVIDMEEIHRVNYLYLHSGKNTSMDVYTSFTGSDWINGGSIPLAYNSWARLNIPVQARECRYVKFEFPAPLDVNEVCVFGSKMYNILPIGLKHRDLVPTKPFEGFMGTNSF